MALNGEAPTYAAARLLVMLRWVVFLPLRKRRWMDECGVRICSKDKVPFNMRTCSVDMFAKRKVTPFAKQTNSPRA